ncbi:DUF4198 domain-containing protein [Sansalvadorimonas verongulae]|uniref:DUF4198 domain-containing protein n=1 Tax=Sansalvadorimonas verongulae TaxID=2172824 RepID=UPI0012BCA512|nr:DUF4198 domain-containing protein [Sansalvadorimonas verongulae]MTI12599.1 DUF4198 domain-containing protein [Sansalvadorimonas verongulae]
MASSLRTLTAAFGLFILGVSQTSFAHFQEMIPQTPVVTKSTGNTLNFDILFTHPMEGGPVMDMGVPTAAGVMVNGEKENLLNSLIPTIYKRKESYSLQYKVKRPGTYQFYLQPAPYFEPAENIYIRQNTKVVVDAYGAGEGWNQPVGLPSEIIPLTRPYALWTGGSFTGVVIHNGKPQPGATVEIEFRNTDKVAIPADAYLNQVVITNANGEFTYSFPRAGWWGFAALIQEKSTIKGTDGHKKEVLLEDDAVLWVHARDMK